MEKNLEMSVNLFEESDAKAEQLVVELDDLITA